MTQGNLKYQFSKLSIAEKLIAINVAIFIVNRLLPFLFRWSKTSIEQWFWLPDDFFGFLTQPWSIITYSFFHAGFGHLFWNMLLIYFVGRIFLNLFNPRRFINVYFLGVMLGGLFFMLGYNIFPVFFNSSGPIIGASAGASAVLLFVCTYIPNQEVRIIMFNVKLWYIGVFVVLTDLIQLPVSGNAGGHIAHLGGALLGFWYAKQLAKGTDIGVGFSKIIDSISQWFTPSEKKGPLKTVYKKSAAAQNVKAKEAYDQQSRQKKIDAILDKISKSGYESLSKGEKDFLFQAGKED